MVCNCYYEARGEENPGKMAVNLVVLARRNSPHFPNSICGVIYQDNQFSWVKDKGQGESPIRLEEPGDRDSLRSCEIMSDYALKHETTVRGPTFYHADYVTTTLANNLRRAAVIGKHIFYSMEGDPLTFTIPRRRTTAPPSRSTQGSR